MPYIPQERREIFDPLIEPIVYQIGTDGEVNYCITKIMDSLYSKGGYAEFNRGIGVLVCVLLELYRKRIAPYEDYKCEREGEVYK